MYAMLKSDGLANPCEPGTGRKDTPLHLILIIKRSAVLYVPFRVRILFRKNCTLCLHYRCAGGKTETACMCTGGVLSCTWVCFGVSATVLKKDM
jgi:hypothetical protein